ncbi:MAG: hydrogenase maturation nickel metallochaperone HypA [Coriobacteriia bacterium]|nr:hydrogenase maturation nickel metallochaperone HypA [Coriobacteriia bacterium]
MHEVGVITSILHTVEDIMKDENLTTVETIVLDVGELSGVVPHFMEECFPAATYKTRFENTKLEMNVIPGNVRCDSCGEEFNAYACDLKCPKCGEDKKHTPLTGRELIIKEIRGN